MQGTSCSVLCRYGIRTQRPHSSTETEPVVRMSWRISGWSHHNARHSNEGVPALLPSASPARHLCGCQSISLRGEAPFNEMDATALNPVKTTSIHKALRMVES